MILEYIIREGWFPCRVAVNIAALTICVAAAQIVCIVGQVSSSYIYISFLAPTGTQDEMEAASETITAQQQQQHQSPLPFLFTAATVVDYHFWIILILLSWVWAFHLQVSYAHLARGSFPYCLYLGRGHEAVAELFKYIPAECFQKPGKLWRVRSNPGWHPRLLVRSSPYKDGKKIFMVRNNDLVERVPLSERQQSEAMRVPMEPRDFRHTSLGWIRRSFTGLTFLEPMAMLATGEMGVWRANSPLLADYAANNSNGMGTPQSSQEMGSRENSPASVEEQQQQQQQKRAFPPRVQSAEELIIQFCFSDGAAADDEEQQ